MIVDRINKLRTYLNKGTERSVLVKKNIVGSLFLKLISIIISLQIIPLTIDYVNPVQYGIWLTLSSIVAWISYFDMGFANGFRNCFAEAMALGKIKLARSYVSTTYAILFILFSLILMLVLFANAFINWSNILNLDDIYKADLQKVFGLLSCFFCLNIVASIFTTLLAADQKPALASLIQTVGQALAFITIFIFTKTIPGDLFTLAFAYSGVPCLFLIIISVILFRFSKYKQIAPSFKYIQFKLVKKILSLGGQFFIILISMLLIFQCVNIILSRLLGPEAVTQYNIVYKYFNVINMLAIIILTPFWSAFTDAYVKNDFLWMKATIKKLEKMWLFVCIPISIIMLLLSEYVYNWWIGESVSIPYSLSISTFIFFILQTAGAIYMYPINGTGLVRLQLLVYLSFTFISIPLIYIMVLKYGIQGALFIPSIVYLVQAIIGKIQIGKIINNKALGIWKK